MVVGSGHEGNSELAGSFGYSSGKPNAMMFGPEATATYCLSSNMNVIGDAFQI